MDLMEVKFSWDYNKYYVGNKILKKSEELNEWGGEIYI